MLVLRLCVLFGLSVVLGGSLGCVDVPEYSGPQGSFVIVTTLRNGNDDPLTCADVGAAELEGSFDGPRSLETSWPCETTTFTTERLPSGSYDVDIRLIDEAGELIVRTCAEEFSIENADFTLTLTFTIPPVGECPPGS